MEITSLSSFKNVDTPRHHPSPSNPNTEDINADVTWTNTWDEFEWVTISDFEKLDLQSFVQEYAELQDHKALEDPEVHPTKSMAYELHCHQALNLWIKTSSELTPALRFLHALVECGAVVRHLQLFFAFRSSYEVSNFILAAGKLDLESLELLIQGVSGGSLSCDESRLSFDPKCFVTLFAGNNFTRMSLAGFFDDDDEECLLEWFIEGLESPKCHLRELRLGYLHGKKESLRRAVTSLASLRKLSLINTSCLLSEPFNVAYANLTHLQICQVQDMSVISHALRDPNFKLLWLDVDLPKNMSIVEARDFFAAWRSPTCKLQHLSVQLLPNAVLEQHLSVQLAVLEELVRACQSTQSRIKSLTLAFPFQLMSNNGILSSLFVSNIERLKLTYEGDIDLDTQNFLIREILDALENPSFSLQHVIIRPRHGNPNRKLHDTHEQKIVCFLEKNFNCSLETLDMWWASFALEKYCSQILERNMIYRKGGLSNQEQLEPPSAKLFVCGQSGVGKTTITKNLSRWLPVPACFQRHLSTYGIHLQPLKFGKKKLLVCDLAGQDEFHAFHHYFVRGSEKDLFLIVCRAPQDDDPNSYKEFNRQLRYWLRFIVSHRTLPQAQKPKVMVALNYFQTNFGKVKGSKTIICCEKVICEYFNDIDFGSHSEDNIFGLIATKHSEVLPLKKQLRINLDCLLERRPKIPKSCLDIMDKLRNKRWKKKVASMDEIKAHVDYDENQKHLLNVSLQYLHDMGEVIYFADHTDYQLVIVDVQWFLKDVVGIFLPRLPRENQSVPSTSNLIMQNVRSRLLEECELAHMDYIIHCLEELGVFIVNSKENEVIVLPLLKEELQNWPQTQGPSNNTFWGRRFECRDSTKTLLPSGIFCMLQTKLHQMKQDDTFGSYKVGNGWLHMSENRIHIVVKIGGETGDWHDRHWIDVLVRIPFDANCFLLEVAESLFYKVKLCLLQVCGARNWGCPSIELVEKVIRPESVEDLTCDAATKLDDILKKAKGDLFYNYTWEGDQIQTRESVVYGMMLPKERETMYLSKSKELKSIEIELHKSLQSKSTPSHHGLDEVSNLKGELKEVVQIVLAEIRNTREDIREAKEEIMDELKRLEKIVKKQMETLQHQGDRVLATVKLHLESRWPKYPYITNANNVLQKFSKSLFGTTVKLHFLCEHGKCHRLEKSELGFTLTNLPQWLKEVAPVLVPALRVLFFTAKVAATIYGGGAASIPTIDPLLKEFEKDAFSTLIDSMFSKIDDGIDAIALSRCNPTLEEVQLFYENFLKGKDIGQEFGLYQVLTHNNEHFWVCEKHRKDHSYVQ